MWMKEGDDHGRGKNPSRNCLFKGFAANAAMGGGLGEAIRRAILRAAREARVAPMVTGSTVVHGVA
jgi:hypothetical protein